jgi:hypothetical protein
MLFNIPFSGKNANPAVVAPISLLSLKIFDAESEPILENPF